MNPTDYYLDIQVTIAKTFMKTLEELEQLPIKTLTVELAAILGRLSSLAQQCHNVGLTTTDAINAAAEHGSEERPDNTPLYRG